MTATDRGPLLRAVAELCDRYPDMRLGQLVANLAGWADVEVWDAEDGQLLAAAEEHLRQAASRERGAE